MCIRDSSASEFNQMRQSCDDEYRWWEPIWHDANACCYNLYGDGCTDPDEFYTCHHHGMDNYAEYGDYARRRLSSASEAGSEEEGHRELGQCDVYSWCSCMRNYLDWNNNECEFKYSMDYYQDYYSFSYSYLENFYALPDDQGCESYTHLWDGLYIEGWGTIPDEPMTLAQCATAVKAYDGTDGCMGDHFFYAWHGDCAFEPQAPHHRSRAV